MGKSTVYGVLGFLVILAILVVLGLFFTVKVEQPFTQLYFENPTNLPKVMLKGNSYEFSFTIENMEYEEKMYNFVILYENEFERDIIMTSSAKLKHGQSITIPVNLQISGSFENELSNNTKISIQLINMDQEIHFWGKVL